MRVPNDQIALALAKGFGNPIISTDPKENIFEDPSLLHDYFEKRLETVIDGGSVPGAPSSVISLIDDIPEIIRYGAGSVDVFE